MLRPLAMRPQLVFALGLAVTMGLGACAADAARDSDGSTSIPSAPTPSTVPADSATVSTTIAAPETSAAPAEVYVRHRVVIDTDLGGGVEGDGEVRGDPDDIQSLVRAIHYSDALEIEGIVSTEAPGTARPELIRQWIRRVDVDHLRTLGYTDLMTQAALLAAVKTGTRDREGPGEGRASEGSRHIIARAHAGSEDDPLWLLAWGSLGTIAQALHDDPTIASKVRLYSIGDYNSRSNSAARDFVLGFLDAHPEFWWVENGVLPPGSHSTFEGVWRGGEQNGQWNRRTFLERHIRGHGTTAGGQFARKLGDAFPAAIGPPSAVGALKEGDSPSLLYLLAPRFGDVGDVDDPTRPSWGGRFRRASADHPNYYVDLDCPEPQQCQTTISRHRVDYLAHWRDRWDRYDTPAE